MAKLRATDTEAFAAAKSAELKKLEAIVGAYRGGL